MSSDCIFFVKAPNLNNLIALVLDISTAARNATVSMYHHRILKCRELIFIVPQVLATPDLRKKRQILAIVPTNIYGSGEFRTKVENIGLQIIEAFEVTDGVLQECFHYTIIARLAPNWNLVGDFLVQGRDFLMDVGSINAVRLDVIVAKEEINLNIHAFCVRIPSLKLEYYKHSFYFQEWEAQGDVSKPLTIPVSEECHVLPSLKCATLLSITNCVPKESCFRDYKEFKKHWKNMYGYRLPDMPPEGIWYCNVTFHVFRRMVYTYPMMCIRPCEPNILPRVDPREALCGFLNDFRRKINTICGQNCQLADMRPAFPHPQLYPANELVENRKPRYGTTYKAPNKTVPYRKNTGTNLPTKANSYPRPYYTPKPLNLSNLMTSQNGAITYLPSKQGLPTSTNPTIHSLTKFKKSPSKSYKPFANAVENNGYSSVLSEIQESLPSMGLGATQLRNETLSNDLAYGKPSYHSIDPYYVERHDNYVLKSNSSSISPILSPQPLGRQGQRLMDSTNFKRYNVPSSYLIQDTIHHESQAMEKKLEKSPFYPLKTFVQKTKVSPQVPTRFESVNLSPINDFFSPLSDKASAEKESAQVFDSIIDNNMANQMLPTRWMNGSPYPQSNIFATPIEESPASTRLVKLPTPSSLRDSNFPSFQQRSTPHYSKERVASRHKSLGTGIVGESSTTDSSKGTPARSVNQLPLNYDKQMFVNESGISQILTPMKASKCINKKVSEQYSGDRNNSLISCATPSKGQSFMGRPTKSPWFSGEGEKQELPLFSKKVKEMKGSQKTSKTTLKVKPGKRSPLSRMERESSMDTHPAIKNMKPSSQGNLKFIQSTSQLFNSPLNKENLNISPDNAAAISDSLQTTLPTSNTNQATVNENLINESLCDKLGGQAFPFDEKAFSDRSQKENLTQDIQSLKLMPQDYDKENITAFDQVEKFQKLEFFYEGSDDIEAVKPMPSKRDNFVGTTEGLISTPNRFSNNVDEEEHSKDSSAKSTSKIYQMGNLSISSDIEVDSSISKTNRSDKEIKIKSNKESKIKSNKESKIKSNKESKIKSNKENKIKSNGKKSVSRKRSPSRVTKSTKPKKRPLKSDQSLVEGFVTKVASSTLMSSRSNSPVQETQELSTSMEILQLRGTPSLYSSDFQQEVSPLNKSENKGSVHESLGSSSISSLLEKTNVNSSLILTDKLSLASNHHIMTTRIAEESSSQPEKVIPNFFKKRMITQSYADTNTSSSQSTKVIPTFFPKKKTLSQQAYENGKALVPDALLAVKVSRGKPKVIKAKPDGKRKKLVKA